MKILLFASILTLSFFANAADCDDNSYVVSVDPRGTASKAEIMDVIKVITNYSNGLAVGNLDVDTVRYPVLSVNFDARRGLKNSFERGIEMLQANPGVLVECSNESIVTR
jgi:hypothetical protein